jgi:hypothetical protein
MLGLQVPELWILTFWSLSQMAASAVSSCWHVTVSVVALVQGQWLQMLAAAHQIESPGAD